MLEYLQDNWLEILGTTVGLIYLYLEWKASIYLWLTSIIMPAIYMFVYFQHGLYADFGIQIYYLIAAFYGLFVWKYGKKKEERVLPITSTPRKYWKYIVLSLLFIWAAIAWILISFTNSTVPYWDSFTTATSIIGLWLLARKYVEQWLIWIAVDVVIYAFLGEVSGLI